MQVDNSTMTKTPKEFVACMYNLDLLRNVNAALTARVMDQVNGTQELVLMNTFAQESNEYNIRKSFEERISEIAAWRFVLEDLSHRLDEATEILKYEQHAINVVIERVETEIKERSHTRPGALCPNTDPVEDAIMEELQYLRTEKKRFKALIPQLENQTSKLEKTKKIILNDVVCKRKAISVEEACANLISAGKLSRNGRNAKYCLMNEWERRCVSLKKSGLQALSSAVITRYQVRQARAQLSVMAQTLAQKVDKELRKRLHDNSMLLQDLSWQRNEAARNYSSLEEEMVTTEKSILEAMEQKRVIAVKLADRKKRPPKENTQDTVDHKLKDESTRLKFYIKDLQNNLEGITKLEKKLDDSILKIETCAEDIMQVVQLDRERLIARTGEDPIAQSPAAATFTTEKESTSRTSETQDLSPVVSLTSNQTLFEFTDGTLSPILEEGEDDYPYNF